MTMAWSIWHNELNDMMEMAREYVENGCIKTENLDLYIFHQKHLF